MQQESAERITLLTLYTFRQLVLSFSSTSEEFCPRMGLGHKTDLVWGSAFCRAYELDICCSPVRLPARKHVIHRRLMWTQHLVVDVIVENNDSLYTARRKVVPS